MIFADKLTHHRKKNGWTQEELAEKMFVSRQAVSKWEGAQAIPDLDKIVQLSELFGVTTDYLLKDEYEPEDDEDPEPQVEAVDPVPPAHRVSLEEAAEYLAIREDASRTLALGTMLCMLAVAVLLLLTSAARFDIIGLSEEAAGILGLIVGGIMVAVAVGLFVLTRLKSAKYRFLNTERIETAYGVDGMVKDRRKNFQETYTHLIVIGAILTVLSVLPLIAIALYKGSLEFYAILMRVLTLAILAVGVYFLIRANVVKNSFLNLLQDDKFYAKRRPIRRRNRHPVLFAIWNWYWIIVTCIYWTWSLWTFDWLTTWIVWPIALILYPILRALLND